MSDSGVYNLQDVPAERCWGGNSSPQGKVGSWNTVILFPRIFYIRPLVHANSIFLGTWLTGIDIISKKTTHVCVSNFNF